MFNMDFHQVKASTIMFLKEAETSFLAIWYFKLILRCKTTSQNIWFYNSCLRNNVTPRYMALRTSNLSSSAKKAQTTGLRKWIIEDRKIQYQKRDISNVYLKVVHTELLFRLDNLEFDIFDNKVRTDISIIIHKKYLTQKSKLDRLIAPYSSNNVNNNVKIYSNHVFFDRFVNSTNVVFSDKEIKLLGKGFNYNLKPTNNKNNLEMLAVECELISNYSENNNASQVNMEKHILADKITKFNTNSNTTSLSEEYALVNSIKNKSVENNIVFTRADKGKTVIALNKENYISKTTEFLNPNQYQIIKSDPTEIFQKQIKNIILDSTIFDSKEKFSLTLMNPQAPKLYSLIKLHKENTPIRPVVSFTTAPSVKISNKMIDIISTHCKFTAKYSIKNSYELVQNIKDLNIPNNAILLSFDVKNLFPSIPPIEVIDIIDNKLTENRTNIIVKQDIINTLVVCLDQNYFEFNDNIYMAKEGLIMGNPLSPLLAELFMDNLESKIHNHKLSKNFLFWFRYVDDIFACFTGNVRQLNIFSNFINSLHNRIEFTLETEKNNSINFLDLTITRINNKLDFSIFHKPSHTDITIHNNSTHPYSHKLAAYNSYIHRLLNIPLSLDNFNKELNIIKQIAVNNGFQTSLIDTIVKNKQYKKAINMVYPYIPLKDNNNFHTLTYIGKPTEVISKYLRKRGSKLAFKTSNKLGKFIKNNKSKVKKQDKSGVYRLKCGSCDKVYIGQTGRPFKKRINEHKRSFLNNKHDSNYANHLLEEQHTLNNTFTILHVENKGRKLNLLESLEINKLKNSNLLLNDQLDLNRSPLLNL